MAYAVGKFAKALCDRCAFEYKLNELKEEWNGLKVCPSCYEPKHPQLEPLTVKADPEALYKPRPNNDKEVGEGFVVVTSSNIFQNDFMNPSILPSNFVVEKVTASLGEVTITTS
jgi:NAD-dependent SIR2 family protein deacetylase|tara:strand:+ start:874 stop:1215 length:342 start_codon:yes stop_codon:yes gene_type:complete